MMDNKLDDLYKKLLTSYIKTIDVQSYECSICLCNCSTAIYTCNQCSNIICSECSKKINKCPICGLQYDNMT